MILEYVWLDGYKPEPNLRSKIQVTDSEIPPMWSFDGSSTKQAEGKSSDCILKPIKTYKGFDGIDKFVLCEVLDNESNTRQHLKADDEWWFAFEQEYFLYQNDMPLGWRNENNAPKPQGEFYCGVGSNNVVGREIAEEHLHKCLNADIDIKGINAEVALGQWEYQCFGKGIGAADDLWMSRYFLQRIAEKHCVTINWKPKPITGDWNGSGLHLNFSNNKMREEGGEEYIKGICESIGNNHDPIKVSSEYGSENEKRLTGLHETQSINQFSYGVSDRGASIRIPVATIEDNWKGRLEDRRPASNADPYRVLKYLLSSI
jgi:glutamine synthetase